MSERVAIGLVCEKGPHPSFAGHSDHGSCGGHYYGTIYVTVELERPGRDEIYTAQQAADALAAMVKNSEDHHWCNYEVDKGGKA